MIREARGTGRTQLPTRNVRRNNVRRSVVDYIKELIFEGQLAPDDRVPQDDVAAALGVSNTPVREALIALEHEGLVTIELHRGAFVNAFDEESLNVRYELYALLFGWATRRAIERASDDDLARMVAAVRGLGTATDPTEMYAAMSGLTATLQELGGSRDWGRLIATLSTLLPGATFYRMPGAMHAASESVTKLTRALNARDADAAAPLMERMIYRHGEALVQELKRKKLLV